MRWIIRILGRARTVIAFVGTERFWEVLLPVAEVATLLAV